MPSIETGRLFRLHCWLIGLVTLAHIASRLLFLAQGRESSISKVLNFSEESSIPTVASTAGLLAAAAVAALIALDARRSGQRERWGWAFVTGCLVFIAFDEGAALHDRLTYPLQAAFDFGGVFYIGWVVPYIALLVVAGLLCLPLAFRLPRRTLWRIILAGTLFVGAALGMELAESALLHRMAGAETALRDADIETFNRAPLMMLLITLEELGEMLAIALLLRAFLLHLVEDRGVGAIRLTA